MANVEIDDIQLISAVTDDVNFPGDDGIQTYRATAAQLKTYILGAGNVSLAALNTSIFTGLTAVSAADDDYFPIVDTSDSNLTKKSLISAFARNTYTALTGTTTITNAGTYKLSGASWSITFPSAVAFVGKIRLIHQGTSLTQVYTQLSVSSQTFGGIASGDFKLHTFNEMVEWESDGSNWIQSARYSLSKWTDAGTMTVTGTTTNPTKSSAATEDKVKWRRDGTDAIINYAYRAVTATAAGAGSGDYLFALPTNLTIDTALITAYTTVLGNTTQWKPSNVVGYGIGSGNTDAGHYHISVYDTTKVRAFFVSASAQSVVCHTSNQNMNIANLSYNFEIRVPISTWQP